MDQHQALLGADREKVNADLWREALDDQAGDGGQGWPGGRECDHFLQGGQLPQGNPEPPRLP